MFKKIKSKLSKFNTINWLSELPTTNFRIFVTMIVFLGTGIKYWTATNWDPSWEWLAFLVTMSGIDVAQFANKRKTSWKPSEVVEVVEAVNGKNKPLEQEPEIG